MTREHLQQTVDIQLGKIKKFLTQRHIQLEVTPEAKMRLAEEGFDPVLGARPLKRVIQRRIQNQLAMRILKGEIKEGDQVIVEVASSSELVFRRESVAEAVPA